MEKHKGNSHRRCGTANGCFFDNLLSYPAAHRISFLNKDYFNG
jgi:hypothetical protein